MIERVHQHIIEELQQNTRTDTIFIITSIFLNLLTLAVNSGIAQGKSASRTIVMLIFVSLTIVVNFVVIIGILKGKQTRSKLLSGLIKMYKDQGVDGYYDSSLLANYSTRYSLRRRIKMREKVLIAFVLGIFSFILFMFAAESMGTFLGDIAAIIVVPVMVVYFFICQFLLSRGNPNALFKDWPIMLALGAVGIVIPIVTALAERREVFLTQGLGFFVVCFVGILGGAFVASKRARRKGTQ